MLPLPTPFDQADEVDLRALQANIEKWNKTGVRGYAVLGSTGEPSHLDARERAEVIEAARAATPSDRVFIVGTGQPSTHATITEVRMAAAAGAEAVLVITPHFYRGAMTPAALINHYTAVADASPVPVVLYSVPQLTGLALAPEAVARLSEHANIIGIKDSSGDLVSFAETLRLVPEEFAVLTGHAAVLYPALSAGACGAIIAVGCVVPHLATEIYRATTGGEHHRALTAQRKLALLAHGIAARYGISGLKAALDLCGYRGGAVRAPLQPASEEARREIERLLSECEDFGDTSSSVQRERSAKEEK